MTKPINHCFTCGSTEKDVEVLISDGTFKLCDSCIDAFHRTKNQHLKNKSTTTTKNDAPLTPRQILTSLNEHIVEQHYAKKVVSTAVYNHYLRVEKGKDLDVEVKKSNIILVGPTGVGKTEISESTASLLGLPMVIVDANEFTASGYVGTDVDNILQRLLEKADGDIDLAEKGIVFIDEIDKIGRKSDNPSITRDVSGEDVQNALLKIIEGTDVHVTGGKRKHPNAPTTSISTRNILFICSGAFAGIEKNISAKLSSNSNGIGFTATVSNDATSTKNIDYSLITHDDLIKYGLTPELVGRLSVIAPLQKLNKESLRRILVEPKNSITKQYQALLSLSDVELEFPESSLERYAEGAYRLGTGARALRSMVEKDMLDILFLAPELSGQKIVVGETDIYALCDAAA